MYKAGVTFFAGYHRVGFGAIVIFTVLSVTTVAWSLYPARSVLLAGSVVLLIALLLAGWWFVVTELSNRKKNILLQALLYAGVVFGGIALLQFIVYTFTDYSLGVQCRGCTADIFGFPRVNGFSAEPQFFANAMIPFVFAALYAVSKQPSKLAWAALLMSVGTIGLTFSRGAYVALAFALIVTGILLYIHKFASIKKILLVYLVIMASVLASWSLLVVSASIRFGSTPNIVYETVDSLAEHLTNGVIDLPESTKTDPQTVANQTNDDFVSPGLIEASSQERLTAAELALRAWRYHPLTALFGVGLGNLGPFVVANIDAAAPSNLTVYIYYVLLLSEMGIVGLLCFVVLYGVALMSLVRQKALASLMVSGCLIAFAVQFLFFGSYINVVYIWLWVGIALGITSVHKTQKTRVNKV